MTIAREGYPFIIATLVPGILLAGLYPVHHLEILLWAGIAGIILGFMCATFFRSPRRVIPDDAGLILSPADGKVVAISATDDEFVGRAHRVDIFLSVFDPHLNRIPAEGVVERINYRPGKFLQAFKDKASEDNERNDIFIAGKSGNIRVAQIAGLIARRIVCAVNKDEKVIPGEIYGMIRFGSRTEITFPQKYAVCVKVSDHVRAGETVIGKLNANA